MLKYWNIILLIILFIAIIIWRLNSNKKAQKASDDLLQTNITFTGHIAGLKASQNHNFGILYINLDKSSGNDFYKPLSDEIFPYKIKDNHGEIYTIIPDGIKVGDNIKVVSNSKTIYYFDTSGAKKTEEFIFIVTNPSDVEFVDKNSKLK